MTVLAERPLVSTPPRLAPPSPASKNGAASAAGGRAEPPIIRTDALTVRYGTFAAVRDVSLDVPPRQVTAIIGPSGCGKSTLLRCFNRMNDFVPGFALRGTITYRGEDIYARYHDAIDLRRRIGMVFQKPNPFPKSVFRNVAWGVKINGYQGNVAERVEWALRRAALWDEVKDKLGKGALTLSGGQQQRLCIARAIAISPDVLLMDEPCSALDPIATSRIEDLINDLKSEYTVVLVTHNMQQAARVSDRTAFMYLGELVEVDETSVIFTRPSKQQTQDYITGRFG